MGDMIVLGLVGALIGFIVYYLFRQKKDNCHSDFCAGCSDHKGCSHCDVDTLKKELKEQLRKAS